jgi:hypothetical protein
MRDASTNLVWRYVYRSDYKKHWDVALAVLLAREDTQSHKELAVLRECRPYELGWLLYTFSGYRMAGKDPACATPAIVNRVTERIQQ